MLKLFRWKYYISAIVSILVVLLFHYTYSQVKDTTNVRSNSDIIQEERIQEQKEMSSRAKEAARIRQERLEQRKSIENNNTKSIEEINREMIQEQVNGNRPRVLQAIENLKGDHYARKIGGIEILQKARDPRGIEPLIAVLNNDTIATTRKDAVRALGTIVKYNPNYKTRVLSEIRGALEDSSIVVKYNAAKVLIDLDDSMSAVATLWIIFRAEDSRFQDPIQVWIDEEVCRWDLPQEEQIKLAENLGQILRQFSLELLIKISEEKVIEELEKSSASDDKWERQKSVNAIEILNKDK